MELMIANAVSLKPRIPPPYRDKILYRSEYCKVPAKAIIDMNKLTSQ
jgi:hypothetical protein